MSLQKKCDEIEKQINEIKGPNKNILPIRDGIINIEKYVKAKFKILWILKESNDVENGEGGGWSLPEKINEKSWAQQNKFKGGRTAFRKMSYCSYSILNHFVSFLTLPKIMESEDVFDAFKHTAYINIKKIPGSSVADEKLISQAYIENKELLFKQIETYNPDILIFGNTMQHFFNDLQIDTEKDKKYADDLTKNTAYYSYPERLYIHAWHPAYFKISEETYCNEIILAVKNWQENFRKKE